jgi:hypothetical protein
MVDSFQIVLFSVWLIPAENLKIFSMLLILKELQSVSVKSDNFNTHRLYENYFRNEGNEPFKTQLFLCVPPTLSFRTLLFALEFTYVLQVVFGIKSVNRLLVIMD